VRIGAQCETRPVFTIPHCNGRVAIIESMHQLLNGLRCDQWHVTGKHQDGIEGVGSLGADARVV
jgi:hypothetical protein